MSQFRIKNQAPPHFIGGRIVGPGDVVTLPEGVRAGTWLEPVEQVAQEPAATPPASGKGKGKGAKAPEPDQQTDTPADSAEVEF